MPTDIDKLIANTFQIAKHVAQVSNLPPEEKTATIMQFHTLVYLEKNQNSTPSEVAKYLNASLSSTTQLIERMHKLAFVTRENDAKDRRVIRLNLTYIGQEKLLQIKEDKKKRMKLLLKNIDKNDITELVRIQKQMVENIQEK